MAQVTVDKHLTTQFADLVHVKAQQMNARLRPHVRMKLMSGDDWAFDTLGDIEALEVQGRIQKVDFQEIDHNRRQLKKRRFVVTLPIDGKDAMGMLLDPEAMYADAVVKAMERRFDRVVIEAMFADVQTGRRFDTTVTYASEGLPTINATAGLTYEKLLEIMKAFIDNEVGNDVPETFVLGISGDEHEDLMLETELTSGDFTRQIVVDRGEIVRAAGFEIVRYGASVNTPLLPVASAVRDCFAMSTRAMCVGMPKEFEITIKDRPDFVDVTQVQIVGQIAALRTEGVLIQRVQTTE